MFFYIIVVYSKIFSYLLYVCMWNNRIMIYKFNIWWTQHTKQYAEWDDHQPFQIRRLLNTEFHEFLFRFYEKLVWQTVKYYRHLRPKLITSKEANYQELTNWVRISTYIIYIFTLCPYQLRSFMKLFCAAVELNRAPHPYFSKK